MKRSKVFLGLITCLLVAVAVAATRAHKFSRQISGYFGTRSNTCGHRSLRNIYYTNGSGAATTMLNRLSYPVYSKRIVAGIACPASALLHADAND